MVSRTIRRSDMRIKLYTFLIFLAVIFLFYTENDNYKGNVSKEDDILQQLDAEIGQGLKDIYGRKIFLMDLAPENKKYVLQPEVSCAVESLALHNPEREILFFTVDARKVIGETFLYAIDFYPNAHIIKGKLNDMIKNTELEQWIVESDIQKYPERLLTVLSYLTLWKHGGTYFDKDVIALKPLSELPINFAGIQEISNITTVSNAIMDFHNQGLAHKIMDDIINNIPKVYNSTDPDKSFGSEFLTTHLHNFCNHTNFTKHETLPLSCGGFSVLDKKAFNPINLENTVESFLTKISNDTTVLNTLNDTVVLHYYTKNLAKETIFQEFANTTLGMLYQKHCPKTYEMIIGFQTV